MDQHDDDQDELQVVAASEKGPTTYTQELGDGEPAGDAMAMSEEGPQVHGFGGTLKVIRPEPRQEPSHTTEAVTKNEQFRRR